MRAEHHWRPFNRGSCWPPAPEITCVSAGKGHESWEMIGRRRIGQNLVETPPFDIKEPEIGAVNNILSIQIAQIETPLLLKSAIGQRERELIAVFYRLIHRARLAFTGNMGLQRV